MIVSQKYWQNDKHRSLIRGVLTTPLSNIQLQPSEALHEYYIGSWKKSLQNTKSFITQTKGKPAVRASTGMSSQVWSWKRIMADNSLNGPCSSLNGPQVSSSHDCMSPAAAAEAVLMADTCVPVQPENTHSSAGFRQSPYHLHHITRLTISTMFPKPLQDSGPNALSHTDVSVCVLHL